jgi:putative transposase
VVQVLCDGDAREGRKQRSTMTRKRRRHTPDQITRKLAEGHKQLAAGTELAEAELDKAMLKEIAKGEF